MIEFLWFVSGFIILATVVSVVEEAVKRWGK